MDTVSTFVRLSDSEYVAQEWEMLDDPGTFQMSDFLAILLGLVFFIVPGLIALWNVIARPPVKGTMVLTNWRLLYYERGEGPMRTHRRVDSLNLEDIVAVHTSYNRGWLDLEKLALTIHTRHEDGFSLSMGDSGGVLGRIPLLGRLFRRRTIGKDAHGVLPVLYNRCQVQRSGANPGSSGF